MKLMSKNFIEQYSITKTLRARLIPIGRTADYITKEGFFENDFKLKAQYEIMKELLNDYYKFYIEETLVNKVLDIDKLNEIYNAFIDKDSDTVDKIETELAKDITQSFKNLKDYYLAKYNELIYLQDKKENDSPLVKFIKNNDGYTTEDREKYYEAIKAFDGFLTYFQDFKKTKENMFSDDFEKKSSIVNRVIKDNMYRFFGNIVHFNKIKEKYNDLYEQISKFEDCFTPGYYADMLAQSKIDNYNYDVIGGDAELEENKGINIILNEYKAKNHISDKAIPYFQPLYKQILSDRTREFIIETITDNDEAMAYAIEAYNQAYAKVTELRKLIADNITYDTLENIEVKMMYLANMSLNMFGDGKWDIFRNALDKDYNENKSITLGELSYRTEAYISQLDTDEQDKYRDALDFVDYFNSNYIHQILPAELPKVDNYKKLKKYLDAMIATINFYHPLYLFVGKKALIPPTETMAFYNNFNTLFKELKSFSHNYDVIRNYATKKPFSNKKLKLNFNNAKLLAGWDLNKEKENASHLFVKDGKYYLGIASSNYKNIFSNYPSAEKDDECYEKAIFKFLPSPSKMLPHVFCGKKAAETYPFTERIKESQEKKLYTKKTNDKQALTEWITYMQTCINMHEEWNQYFNFEMKDPAAYEDVSEFYNDIENCGYSMKYVKVPASYIDELVEDGKLYLFEIYYKDFSRNKMNKNGRDSIYTSYVKNIFSKENIEAINSGKPYMKISAGGELFMREASIKAEITHPKNKMIKRKNPAYSELDETDPKVFNYDIYKDKRYTETQYFFHFPIAINVRSGNDFKYNEKINEFVSKNKDVNILAIERGEDELLNYCVLDRQGNILDQGNLNVITNHFVNRNGDNAVKSTDYKLLMQMKNSELKKNKDDWEPVAKIKDIESGYLTQAINQVVKLMDKYNAVVVMEKLSKNYKRKGVYFDERIYQHFEEGIIKKLNYVFFKDREYTEEGSYAKAYQLTPQFDTWNMISKQFGAIYYVPTAYNSNIDPATGFINLTKIHYFDNKKDFVDHFSKYESVRYNEEKDYFEFVIDMKKFTDMNLDKSIWTVCSYGNDRYEKVYNEDRYLKHELTKEFKKLFYDYKINYKDNNNILDDIIQAADNRDFRLKFNKMMVILLNIKQNCGKGKYIYSCVADNNGEFFDSRKENTNAPKNADLNGVYNTARKGLMLIDSIEDNKIPKEKEDMLSIFINSVQK